MKSAIKLGAIRTTLIIGALLFMVTPFSHASAISGSDWKAGRIIDDNVFTSRYDMTVQEIQTFLNKRVPTCDTYGTKPSELGGGTRAQYGASHGNPAPFTCLKDYYEVPKTAPGPGEPASNYGGVAIPAGAQSAAQIISNAAVKYNISPKVLLVKLATESPGPLTSDDWPFKRQYLYAMGAHCPDSGPGGAANCDSNYASFSLQMEEAAELLRWYLDSMTQPWWQYKKPYQVNSILWNVSQTGCGAGNVYIESKATAALYTYTPYQPNQAALNNLYGTGDGCSAYGNRNFWRVFNDWFISYDTIFRGVQVSQISQVDSTPARGQGITYKFTLTNTLSSAVTLNAVGTAGRAGSLTGPNRDLGWVGPVTLQPGASQQFTFTSVVQDVGTLYIWPVILFEGTYIQYNNWGSTLTSHAPNFTLSQPLVASPSPVYAGQNVTFSATLKNNEDQPINYDAVGIPVKFYDSYSYDAIWVGPGIVAAGGEIPLSGVRNIDKPGPYTYWVSNYFGGAYTTIGGVPKLNAQEVSPNFSVTGINFSNTTPVQGGNLGASITVKNNLPVPIDVDAVGVVGRLGTFSGANRDLGWQGPVHFNAGESKTFTGYSRAVTDVGTHHYWIGILYNGSYIQYNNWGSTLVSRAPSFSVSGISFTDTTPAQGESLGASFSVTNNLSVPVDMSAVGVVGRLGTFSGANRDLGWQGPVHFNPNETKAFTGFTRSITDIGTHYYWIGVLNNGSYIQYNNWGSTIVSHSP